MAAAAATIAPMRPLQTVFMDALLLETEDSVAVQASMVPLMFAPHRVASMWESAVKCELYAGFFAEVLATLDPALRSLPCMICGDPFVQPVALFTKPKPLLPSVSAELREDFDKKAGDICKDMHVVVVFAPWCFKEACFRKIERAEDDLMLLFRDPPSAAGGAGASTGGGSSSATGGGGSAATNACYVCNKPAGRLTCPDCSKINYCSMRCLKAHEPCHGLVCGIEEM